MSTSIYTLNGTAKDIETIARLRPWMEDEVRGKIGSFKSTDLVTDYDEKSTVFSFKIRFYS